MTMHPFIKITCLLATIILLISSSPLRILLILLLLCLLLMFAGRACWHAVWKMSKRMKWFWLSLLVLYGWFIPGTPILFLEVIPVTYIPSVEGLSAGGLRALALFSIVSAVVLMVKSSTQGELIVSIMWLISPLRLLKIQTTQFAARLVLTLENVTNTEHEIYKELFAGDKQVSVFQHGIYLIANLLVAIEKQAVDSSDQTITLPELDAPALYQWLIPIFLVAGLYIL